MTSFMKKPVLQKHIDSALTILSSLITMKSTSLIAYLTLIVNFKGMLKRIKTHLLLNHKV